MKVRGGHSQGERDMVEGEGHGVPEGKRRGVGRVHVCV